MDALLKRLLRSAYRKLRKLGVHQKLLDELLAQHRGDHFRGEDQRRPLVLAPEVNRDLVGQHALAVTGNPGQDHECPLPKGNTVVQRRDAHVEEVGHLLPAKIGERHDPRQGSRAGVLERADHLVRPVVHQDGIEVLTPFGVLHPPAAAPAKPSREFFKQDLALRVGVRGEINAACVGKRLVGVIEVCELRCVVVLNALQRCAIRDGVDLDVGVGFQHCHAVKLTLGDHHRAAPRRVVGFDSPECP